MAEITEAEIRDLAKKLVEEVPPDKVDQFEFRGAQFDHGLAFVQFPEGLGGLGLESQNCKRWLMLNYEALECLIMI